MFDESAIPVSTRNVGTSHVSITQATPLHTSICLAVNQPSLSLPGMLALAMSVLPRPHLYIHLYVWRWISHPCLYQECWHLPCQYYPGHTSTYIYMFSGESAIPVSTGNCIIMNFKVRFMVHFPPAWHCWWYQRTGLLLWWYTPFPAVWADVKHLVEMVYATFMLTGLTKEDNQSELVLAHLWHVCLHRLTHYIPWADND